MQPSNGFANVSCLKGSSWVLTVCGCIAQGTKQSTILLDPSGLYAYVKVTNEVRPDCDAAIAKFQSAFSNFAGLPPNKGDGRKLYSNQDNVSFVAIYNPEGGAVADCRVVTCTAGEATVGSKQGSGLVCFTKPDPFRDNTNDVAPFT